MFCISCGERIPSDSKFCTHCGYSLQAKEVVPEKVNSLSTELPISEEVTLKEGSGRNHQKSVIGKFQDDRPIDTSVILLEVAKEAANKEIMKGIFYIALGIGITFITWLFASDGGTYYIFYGLSYYGAYVSLRGLYYRVNPIALINKAQKTGEEEKKK